MMTEQHGLEGAGPEEAERPVADASRRIEDAVQATAHAQAAVSEAAIDRAHQATDAFETARQQMTAMSDMAFGRAGHDAGHDFATGVAWANGGLLANYAAAAGGLTELNRKIVDAWRANAESALAHWKKLSTVTTLSEAIALNAEHTRQQMEAVMTQTRELSTLATQFARNGIGGTRNPSG